MARNSERKASIMHLSNEIMTLVIGNASIGPWVLSAMSGTKDTEQTVSGQAKSKQRDYDAER